MFFIDELDKEEGVKEGVVVYLKRDEIIIKGFD